MPKVSFRMFRARMKSWEALLEEVAAFASTIGRGDLISISHSEDANEGVVTVWYWE